MAKRTVQISSVWDSNPGPSVHLPCDGKRPRQARLRQPLQELFGPLLGADAGDGSTAR